MSQREMDLFDEANDEALNLKLHLYDNKQIDKIATKIRYWVEKNNVKAVVALLDEGASIPFIARYRNFSKFSIYYSSCIYSSV